jgi:hypothetical protein
MLPSHPAQHPSTAPTVTHLWEDARGCVVGLDDDVPVELRGVESQCPVEVGARVVVQVHGDVDGQAEEAGPEAVAV